MEEYRVEVSTSAEKRCGTCVLDLYFSQHSKYRACMVLEGEMMEPGGKNWFPAGEYVHTEEWKSTGWKYQRVQRNAVVPAFWTCIFLNIRNTERAWCWKAK